MWHKRKRTFILINSKNKFIFRCMRFPSPFTIEWPETFNCLVYLDFQLYVFRSSTASVSFTPSRSSPTVDLMKRTKLDGRYGSESKKLGWYNIDIHILKIHSHSTSSRWSIRIRRTQMYTYTYATGKTNDHDEVDIGYLFPHGKLFNVHIFVWRRWLNLKE